METEWELLREADLLATVAKVASNQTEYETDLWAVALIALFDHDYEAHVLVQRWDRDSATPTAERRWTYGLYYVDGDGARLVRDYPLARYGQPPLIDVAARVAHWLKHRRYA